MILAIICVIFVFILYLLDSKAERYYREAIRLRIQLRGASMNIEEMRITIKDLRDDKKDLERQLNQK